MDRKKQLKRKITQIERSKTHNKRTSEKLKKLKTELSTIVNYSRSSSSSSSNLSSSVSSVSVSTVSSVSDSSNVSSSTAKSSKGNREAIDISSIISDSFEDADDNDVTIQEFNDMLEDPEIPNYNKIQMLKARYLNLISSKFITILIKIDNLN
jgi:hypothetical protein